ncbi:HK97 family phage prohead protease [Rhodococcus opacus]|uniref:HK97 family phage prohead protease n=1 Tax=Rhodococcus opacus TaxID=37919 RepID=UPI001FF37F3E|nr:HK97 family phage prohead protease [Rhodococcus opacus]UOT02273.1 HK97 family phage prohead protease [Rhodococcus opacus]
MTERWRELFGVEPFLKYENQETDPNADNPRVYWTLGTGAVAIAWGFEGDFERCKVELSKHVGGRAAGLCASYHRDLFGVVPRESVMAAKPPLPDDWDFDAETVEDALPADTEAQAPATVETPAPAEATEDDPTDDEDTSTDDAPDTRTRRQRERDRRRGRSRTGRGKSDVVPDLWGHGLRPVDWRPGDAHDRPDSGGTLERGDMAMKRKGVEVGKIKAGPDDNLGDGEFIAYASIFGNVDSYGDVVQPGAFAKSIEAWAKSGNTVPILYGHDAKNPHMNVGGVVTMEEDGRGLKIHGRLDLDTDTGAQVYRLVKGRRLSQLSFAYDEVRTRPVKGDPRLGNYKSLDELHVHEVSLVPVGANRATEVLAVKAAPTGPTVAEWDRYLTAARFGSVSAPA